MIYGERVRQVREMHHLTQAALAEKIPRLTQWKLSRFEAGLSELDEELVALLAAASGVTVDYLERQPSLGLIAHSPQLRSRTRVTQGAKNAALQWARLIQEELQRLLRHGTPLPVRLGTLHGEQPATAAHHVRELLGFTLYEPLPYLVLAMERLGVSVLGIPLEVGALDAFCAWCDDDPVIGILAGIPGDRVRFSVAHELGHLVLHSGNVNSKEVEVEADTFAAELLTPADALLRAMPQSLTLNSLIMMKSQWGTSVKSLIRRARELDIIDQDRATSLYRQVSARGWNRAEPGHVPVEKPRAFRKLAEIAYGPGPNVARLAREAGWSQELAFLVLDQFATHDELPYERDASLWPEEGAIARVIALRPKDSVLGQFRESL